MTQQDNSLANHLPAIREALERIAVALERLALPSATQSHTEGQAKAIVAREDVQGGQPCFEGTRIPVRAVVSFANAGYSAAQIVGQYPSLTEEDVRAALSTKDNTKG